MVRLKALAHRGRNRFRHYARSPIPGQFQPYNHTLPDRYPWLFRFAGARLQDSPALRLLSFGCSRGDEVFALRSYFPSAIIRGIDIDPGNIAVCEARAQAINARSISFAAAATTKDELASSFDAIFCLAVLCHGDLTASGAQRSDPLLRFEDYERMVADFERCLKPGGLLLLHATSFRFGDTASARNFDIALETELSDLAPDVVFDRNNRLMQGERYRPVAFCKRVTRPDRT
jgi:SAM-dependent methyltransferase